MPLLAPFSLSKGLSSLARLNHKRGSRVPSENEGSEKPLPSRLLDVFLRTWDLGFTAFGGPPVHFQILHSRFVEGKGDKEKWVDEQTVRFSLIFKLARSHVIGPPNIFHSIRNSLLSVRVFRVPVARRWFLPSPITRRIYPAMLVFYFGGD
jgi:Chromate transport protein ChrA